MLFRYQAALEVTPKTVCVSEATGLDMWWFLIFTMEWKEDKHWPL